MFAELSIDRPVVPMVADDPVPDAMPEAEVRAAVDDVTPDREDTVVVEEVVDAVAVPAEDATPVTELDATAEVSGAELVDSAEVSGEMAWALEPPDVLATCASAVAWPAVAVSEVVGGGGGKGEKVEAVAARPW